MEIHTEHPCNPTNYQEGRAQPVQYLVIHYTGSSGGARDHARFYSHERRMDSSTHYFVGHASEGAAVYQSVAEGDTAWHCGSAKGYRHPECRNENSIGVELCCWQDGDKHWYFDPETVDAAVALCQDIMGRHGIATDHVLRHYDVTGKVCPAPFVNDPAAWAAFLARLG